MHFDIMTKSCFAQINFENHTIIKLSFKNSTKIWKNFAMTQSTYKFSFDEFYLLPLL